MRYIPRIFLHGLGQTPKSWDPVLSNLDGTFGICPDYLSPHPWIETAYGYLWPTVMGVCDKFDGPLDICGLSLGAMLALDYATRRPEKVRSLALIAAQYKSPRRLLKLQNAVFRLLPEQAFRQTGLGKENVLSLCRSMMKIDLTPSLQKVSCPVLVICGKRDLTNRPASKRLANLLPNAQLRVISGAGHEVNTEAPHELAGAVQEFWETVSSE